MSVGQLSAAQIPGLTLPPKSILASSGGYSVGTGAGISMGDENYGVGTGMNIRIIPANGGTIISIKDEFKVGSPDFYVLSETQNIAEEIGKIITLHYLKNNHD
jgi:hypothetical protein